MDDIVLNWVSNCSIPIRKMVNWVNENFTVKRVTKRNLLISPNFTTVNIVVNPIVINFCFGDLINTINLIPIFDKNDDYLSFIITIVLMTYVEITNNQYCTKVVE